MDICKSCEQSVSRKQGEKRNYVIICDKCMENIIKYEIKGEIGGPINKKSIKDKCMRIRKYEDEWDYPTDVIICIEIANTINAINEGLISLLNLITIKWISNTSQEYRNYKLFKSSQYSIHYSRKYTKRTISNYNISIDIIINHIMNTTYTTIEDNLLKSEILFHCFNIYKNRFNPIQLIHHRDNYTSTRDIVGYIGEDMFDYIKTKQYFTIYKDQYPEITETYKISYIKQIQYHGGWSSIGKQFKRQICINKLGYWRELESYMIKHDIKIILYILFLICNRLERRFNISIPYEIMEEIQKNI